MTDGDESNLVGPIPVVIRRRGNVAALRVTVTRLKAELSTLRSERDAARQWSALWKEKAKDYRYNAKVEHGDVMRLYNEVKRLTKEENL